MAFERPTIDEIQQRCYADFRSEMPGDEPTILLQSEYAFVAAQAGMSHVKHGRISNAMRQQFPDTADSEGLDHWASVWGVPRQQPQKAAGSVTAFGAPASVIPLGTPLVSPQDDLTYVTTAAAVIPAIGQVEVFIEADNTGSEYNKADKTLLQFSSPPAGIDAEAIVLELSNGSGLESDTLLVSRVLARIQGGKLIGKPGDWVQWALEVPGTTRAWEQAGFLGPGSIGVFFLRDDDPISAIPDVAQVATMQTYLDTNSPTAYTNLAAAPTDATLPITVTLTPDTPSIRTAVEDEVAAMLIREASPLGFVLALTTITEAIGRGTSGEFSVTSPIIDITYPLGFLPITFAMTYL